MKTRTLLTIFLIGLFYTSYSQNIKWEQKANLPKPMRGTAITCNNMIYFMEAKKDTSGVYEYNPINDSWKKKTNMITQGWNVNLAELDGIIYAIGGDKFRDRAESYNPENNQWEVLAPMPTARQHSNCCVFNNEIYVMGGITSWTDQTDKNEVYNPKTNSWKTKSPLPLAHGNPIIASIDNKIYALCGDTLRAYDPKSDTWELKTNCPAWVAVMFGCAVLPGKMIIVGGQNREGEALSSVYIYDTKMDKWTQSTDLPKPVQIGGITTLNGKLYIVGGCDSEFKRYDTVYEGTLRE